MSRLRTILAEIVGLFVDDGAFALAILTWLGGMLFLGRRAVPHTTWLAVALFAGLAIILIESVLRFSRKRRK